MALLSRIVRRVRLYCTGVLSCLYLLTFGMRRPEHRHMLNQVNWHLGWGLENRPDPDAGELPVRPLREVVPPQRVTMVEGDHVAGNVTAYELFAIASVLRAAGARTVFEVGTFDGRTALNMAANLPEDGEVHTLDLPPEDLDRTALPIHGADRSFIDKAEVAARVRALDPAAWPEVGRIHLHLGDSATFDYAPLVGRFDAVFIDGSHSYEYVLSDTERALALLREGRGWLLWHDYCPAWPEVVQALDELQARNPDAGLCVLEGTHLAALRLDGEPLRLWEDRVSR